MTLSMPLANSVVRVHRFLPRTMMEGPGLRAAIWVQGCPIHCPGCFNRETWAFEGGKDWRVVDLYNNITDQPDLEGITLVGGEPFSHAEPLAELAGLCRRDGLSVVTFSGYRYSALRAANKPDWDALLAVTDLLLAGSYLATQRDFSRPWVGSRNQEFIFLTDRYSHLKKELDSLANGIEIFVEADGAVSLNGLAPEERIREVENELVGLGLRLTRPQLENIRRG